MLEGIRTIVDFLMTGVHTVLDFISSIPSWISTLSSFFDFLPTWLAPLLLVVVSVICMRFFVRSLPG